VWCGPGPAGQSAAQSTGATPTVTRNTSLESIFKQILEANQINDQKTSRLIVSLANDDKYEDSHDPDSRRDLSTKVMNYEQIMACLGKKTLKVKQEERRKNEEERARDEQLKQQQMQLDAMYGDGSFSMFPRGMMVGPGAIDPSGKVGPGPAQQTLCVSDVEESKD